MGLGRRKLRAAEWLYRWNLSLGIIGILFTVLTFMGVFTLILGPVFSRLGLSYLETALILLAIVLSIVIGFGVFLDKVIRFWAAQATVATVRNPYLVDVLYQKEFLSLLYIQLPLLRTLRAVAAVERMPEGTRTGLLGELDVSIAKVERSIRDKKWPIEAHERVY